MASCDPGLPTGEWAPDLPPLDQRHLDSAAEAALVDAAAPSVSAMLLDCLQFNPATAHLFVLYDEETSLSRILSAGYRRFIDDHCADRPESFTFLKFGGEAATPAILERLAALQPEDAVILVQSVQFRLNEYRIRIELFNRHIKTIEHVFLCVIPTRQFPQYVAALAFSPRTSGALAHSLKSKVDSLQRIEVSSGSDSVCVYSGGLQPCKLNIGDYRGMSGVGGTFPIGEVFSEAKDLRGVNGKLAIFAYPGLKKTLVILEVPIILEIVAGVVQFDPEKGLEPEQCTDDFRQLLKIIRAGEGEIILREFGLGLNKGMGRSKPVQDIFAFERQYGLHVSLGKKHNVFKVEGIKGKATKFHIDVFVDVKTIIGDGEAIYENGRYTEDREQ